MHPSNERAQYRGQRDKEGAAHGLLEEGGGLGLVTGKGGHGRPRESRPS